MSGVIPIKEVMEYEYILAIDNQKKTDWIDIKPVNGSASILVLSPRIFPYIEPTALFPSDSYAISRNKPKSLKNWRGIVKVYLWESIFQGNSSFARMVMRHPRCDVMNGMSRAYLVMEEINYFSIWPINR